MFRKEIAQILLNPLLSLKFPLPLQEILNDSFSYAITLETLIFDKDVWGGMRLPLSFSPLQPLNISTSLLAFPLSAPTCKPFYQCRSETGMVPSFPLHSLLPDSLLFSWAQKQPLPWHLQTQLPEGVIESLPIWLHDVQLLHELFWDLEEKVGWYLKGGNIGRELWERERSPNCEDPCPPQTGIKSYRIFSCWEKGALTEQQSMRTCILEIRNDDLTSR